MRKLAFAIIALFCIYTPVSAQFDPQFSQNFNCTSMLNPSMMSLDGNAKALALYRNQWMGLEGNPKTFFAEIYAPFTFGQNRHVFGLKFMNDQIGLFTNNSVELQYAFKKKLWGGELSLGAELGGLFIGFDGTGVVIPDKGDYHVQPGEDKVIPTGKDNSGFGFDLTLGASYSDESKYLGVSCLHLTGPSASISDYAEVKLRPLIYVVGGYNVTFPTSPLQLKPSVCFKSDFASWQLDANFILQCNKIYGGVSYRYQDAVVLILGVRNFKKLDIGLSYDITTSKLITVSSGSLELFASYSFSLEFEKKKKYKSIRIL